MPIAPLPSLLVSLASTAAAQRATADAVPRHLITRPDLQAGSTTRPAIMLTGYWPPSNEGIRRFCTDPVQNPDGWIGSDWEGRGYDVHAFFAEYSPPTCIACGQGSGDLEADYQDTSADFFPLADSINPIAIITFSSGVFNQSWEVEMNQHNRSTWVSDFNAPLKPTPSPPDSSVPAGFLRLSTLPVNDIVAAVDAAGLGLTPYVCYTGDTGGYLSEFMAYHGVWYQSLHASPTDPSWVVCAGHIHVGANIAWPTAEAAVGVTLREVISYVDAVVGNTACQTDVGFGGPGSASLSVCGDPLTPGAEAELFLTGAPSSASAFLIAGLASNPTPLFGGNVVPVPPVTVLPLATDPDGKLRYTLVGGALATTAYVQLAILDASAPFGFALSNAVAVDVLP